MNLRYYQLKKHFDKTAVIFKIKINLLKPIHHNFSTRSKSNNINTPKVHKSFTQSSCWSKYF